MKTEEINKDKLVKVSQSALLALVAEQLKGRVLFPEKTESAKKYIKSVVVSAL